MRSDKHIPWARLQPFHYAMICAALTLALCACATGQVLADPASDWIQVRDREGISIYTQQVSGSSIIKVRTETTIHAAMADIQAILDRTGQRANWVPYLRESRLLYRFSAGEKLEYSRFSAPWPASDRDFVYRVSLLHQDEHSMGFNMISEVHARMPENTGVVRAQLIESRYTLTALGPRQTRVELIFHADPKGWLPVWIINIIQQALPFMMLKNLRQLAQASG